MPAKLAAMWNRHLLFVDEILAILENKPELMRYCFIFWSYLSCFQVLQAYSDPRAGIVLDRAYQRLQERASQITGDRFRHSYLENVPWHREIVALWQAAQPG